MSKPLSLVGPERLGKFSWSYGIQILKNYHLIDDNFKENLQCIISYSKINSDLHQSIQYYSQLLLAALPIVLPYTCSITAEVS
jgi:hypothetical protein